MKRKGISTILWSCILTFLLSYGSISAFVTGFRLDVPDSMPLILGAVSLFFSLCYGLFESSALALGSFALVCGYFWQTGSLLQQCKVLLEKITDLYHRAYGWGAIIWPNENLEGIPVTIPLLLWGSIIALLTAWTVCQQKRSWFSLLSALIPFFACIVVTDSVPKEISLYLLMLGMVLLLLTQFVRRTDLRQGNRLATLLLLPCALSLALLFWAIPKSSYTPPERKPEELFQSWVDKMSGSTASQDVSDWIADAIAPPVQDTVHLSYISPLPNALYRVMDVTAAADGPLYLRGVAYDTYNGKSWSASKESWAEPGYVKGSTLLGTVTVETRAVHDVLYFPYSPVSSDAGTTVTPNHLNLKNGYLPNPEGKTVYSFPQFREVLPLPDSAVPVIPDSTEEMYAQYLQLPESTKAAALRILEENGLDVHDPALVEGIRAFVQNSAVYDRQTPRMPADAEDFAIWFLLESDRGYCVHFATAATVLLRAAGVPARYVTGYLADGTAGEKTAVLEQDSHAWVEYCIPEQGWTRLECTPSSVVTNAPTPSIPTDVTVTEATSESPTTSETTEAPHTEGTAPQSPDAPDHHEETSRPIGKWLLLAVGFIGAVLLQWRLRLAYHIRKLKQKNPNQRFLAGWQLLERYCRHLRQSPPDEIRNLAEKAKFSQYLTTREEWKQLEEALRIHKAQLQKKPWPMRCLFRLIFALY